MNKPPAKSAAERKTPVAKGAASAAAKPAEAPKSPSKAAAKTPAPMPDPVVATSPPVSNRFTDRFAPARPNPKPDHVPIEAVKPAAKVDPKLANAWKTKAGRELSEPELLAMPEAEYMNDKQLDFFRNRLQQQKDDLLSNAGETTEHLREDTTIVPDPADRATIEEEHALELRTRDRERKLISKINEALIRIDQNEYGFCEETGEPIGVARLEARPVATLSLEAQERHEKMEKTHRDD